MNTFTAKMKKQNAIPTERKDNVFVHILGWCFVFGLPAYFAHRGGFFNWQDFFSFLPIPISFMITFYVSSLTIVAILSIAIKITLRLSQMQTKQKEMENQTPDVIFLDIQMPYINGLEFAQIIEEDTKIIFTTAFKDYAINGYKVNAIDYLLKPFSYANFLTAAKKHASKSHIGRPVMLNIIYSINYDFLYTLFFPIFVVDKTHFNGNTSDETQKSS